MTAVLSLTTLEEIERARASLPPEVRRTPIVPVAPTVGDIEGERLFLKAECLQVTGSFKVRAAFNVMQNLTAEQRAAGVVLTSSGNFAQAFAFAGAQMGSPIVVVMLDSTSPYKVAATRDLGAEVFFAGTDAAARQPIVEKLASDRSMTAIDTWEERPIIAGHASIGLEILEDMPDVEQILVPVSSGGFASGIATAVKLKAPHVRVIGVQPEKANAYFVSRQAGEPTTIGYWDSLADGLSARRPGRFPFQHLQEYLDDIVLISEAQLAGAVRTLLFRTKLLVEPAGVVGATAFLSGTVDTSLPTVAVATGGNVTEDVVLKMLDMSS